MAEQEASVASVTEDVSDEQIDKYFESGGEEGIEESEVQEEKAGKETVNENQSQQEEQKKKEDKYVPYDALHEERMRRKEIQQELQEMRSKSSQLEQNFQRIMERVNQQNMPKPPSFEEDPLGALRYENNIIKQVIQQEQLSKQQREQYEHQQEQLFQRQQQFVGRYQNDAREYMESTAPDFKEAYAYLNRSYLKEFTESGFSKEEANRLLIENETAIVGKAYQAGMNPAERMYNLAKMRGYQPASKTSGQKLDQLERGVKASRNLNAPGGKSDSGPITLDQVAHLSDEELDEFISNPKKWDKFIKSHQ